MSLDDLQAQLRGAVDQQFAALKAHYDTAIADARDQAKADAEREMEAKLVAARAEWQEQLSTTVAAVRAEAEQAAADADAKLRHEFEQAREEAVASSLRSAELEFESERKRVGRELETERERSKSILEEAKAAIDRERQQAREELDAASAQLERDLKREFDGVLAQRQTDLTREFDAAHAQRETDLRREFDAARAQLERELKREFDGVLAQRETDLKREFEAARLRREIDLKEEFGAAHAQLESDLKEELEAVRAQLESDLASAREATAREAAVAAAAKASLANRAFTAASSSAASVAMYDRVATGIRTLDATTALGPALDALVSHAGALTGRAALYVVNGDRLKAWKSAGIPDIDVQTVESPIAGRDLLARAIQAGQPTASGPLLPAPPFARLPPERTSLAVPLMIGGRAVAVLYVDSGPDGGAAPVEWQGAVDLLTRHASALLALRTAMRTFDVLRGVPEAGNGNGGGEEGARRYAKLLVSEIKLYNESAVRAGRQLHDLRRRLQSEIERAQRLYQERVPPAVSARDQYFNQELVQTLADGDASLLGN
jgi:hypothetical protein